MGHVVLWNTAQPPTQACSDRPGPWAPPCLCVCPAPLGRPTPKPVGACSASRNPWAAESMQGGRGETVGWPRSGWAPPQGPALGDSQTGPPPRLLHRDSLLFCAFPAEYPYTLHKQHTEAESRHAVARDCQAGEGAPGEVISQALNRLMSWGLISPGSGDCPCPPPRKQAQRQPWVLGGHTGSPRSWSPMGEVHTRCQVPRTGDLG